MAFSSYRHGVEIDIKSDGIQRIKPLATSVVGVVGTAMNGEDRTPVIIKSIDEAVEVFGEASNINLKNELNKKIETKNKVITAHSDTITAVEGNIEILSKQLAEATEVEKEVLNSEIKNHEDKKATAKRLKTKAENELKELKAEFDGVDVTEHSLIRSIKAIYSKGSPVVIAVRCNDNEEEEAIKTLTTTKTSLGITPNILIAPTKSHSKSVADALLSAARMLDAVAIIGSDKNDGKEDSLRKSKRYASSRIYMVHGWVDGSNGIGELDATPFVASLIAWNDLENGYWASPSNKTLESVNELINPAHFNMNDSKCDANELNEAGVAVIIREDGYRLWGSRTLGKSEDSDHKFLNVRRTTDAIKKMTQRAIFTNTDMPMGPASIEIIKSRIELCLRDLKQDGAIIDGSVWEEGNTPESMADGIIHFAFDYSPVYPMEQIKITQIVTTKYLNTNEGS